MQWLHATRALIGCVPVPYLPIHGCCHADWLGLRAAGDTPRYLIHVLSVLTIILIYLLSILFGIVCVSSFLSAFREYPLAMSTALLSNISI
jgi:hypothetical protein